METVISYLRQIIGTPSFYKQLTGTQNYTWDYASMFEYVFAGLLVLIVVSNIFRFIRVLVK